MGEPARSIRCRNSSKGVLKSFLQSLTGSRSDATQNGFDLGKSLFNGRKIWGRGRQKQQLTASSFDDLSHLFSLMDAQIIHDHHLSRQETTVPESARWRFQRAASWLLHPRSVLLPFREG